MEVTAMSGQQDKPREAYILSLVGGTITLIGSVIWIALAASGWLQDRFYWFDYYMHGLGGHMVFLRLGSFGYLMAFAGLVSGVVIILASIMLNRRPSEHGAWGLLIVVFSITSMMAGLGIGLLLGLVGGILAILWQPPRPVSAGTVQQA